MVLVVAEGEGFAEAVFDLRVFGGKDFLFVEGDALDFRFVAGLAPPCLHVRPTASRLTP